MDAIWQTLFKPLHGPWGYAAGVLVLLIMAVPRLLAFLGDLQDERLGRRRLELEKLRLEVLKLRIDVLKAEQKHPTHYESKHDPGPWLSAAPPPAGQPAKSSGLGKLIARYPRVGRPLALIAQVVLAFWLVVLAFDAVYVPVENWTNPKMGPAYSIFAALWFGGLSVASGVYFMKVRSIRQEDAAIRRRSAAASRE